MGPATPLKLLLLGAALLRPAPAGLPDMALLEEAAPPGLDATFDPVTWTATWRCAEGGGDVTVTLCGVRGGAIGTRKMKPQGCRCAFSPLLLHRGLTLELNGTADGRPAHSRLRYGNPGAEGSAARNLSCVIRDARVFECAWGAGPKAPDDVRYVLHVKNSSGDVVAECPAHPGGCRLEDLRPLPPSVLYVLVTGSSRSGAAVQFYDAQLRARLIERLSPPTDVTTGCNSSHCEVTWAPPPTWVPMTSRDFRYELDLQRQDAPRGSQEPTVLISSPAENRHVIPSPAPRPRLLLRLRAGDVRSPRWSAWSPAVVIGPDARGVPRALVYAMAAAATLLCALGLFFACRRFARSRALFPPIPQIRDKVSDDARVNAQTIRKDLLQPMTSTRTADAGGDGGADVTAQAPPP